VWGLLENHKNVLNSFATKICLIIITIMLTSILATKLFAPRQRPKSVPRPELLQRLNEALYGRLTLISAPAGFGKTTLASQWITKSGYPHAWLSLDKSDSDPSRFLIYVISAFAKIIPNVGAGLIERLHSPQPPSYESVLIALINNILASINEPVIFVLDDYHVLDSPAIDRIVEFLLEHQPPQMHLVITTREDPSFSFAYLRARGELTEIRIADLRFTAEEIAIFLNESMGLNLSTDDVNTLEARTEGWIASLQMVAISMRGHEDIAGFLRSFTGSHRFILDYLVEEVLHKQADYIQEFLYQTSILERFNASLCNQITEREDSQEILETLERQNLLIIPLDDERQWYRYHHLFADVLNTYAKQKIPERVSHCQQLASEWYEAQGYKSEAIHYAHAAKDDERVADLLELSWPAIFNGFKPSTWLGWVRTLPDDMVKLRPILSAGYAWVLLDEREVDEVEDRLRDAEHWLDTPNSFDEDSTLPVIANKVNYASLPSTIAGGYAYLSHVLGDAEGTIEHALRALELLPEDDHYNRGLMGMFLGMGYWTMGKLTLAYDAFENSVASLKRSSHLHFQIVSMVRLAEIRMAQGRLHDALIIYNESLHTASSTPEAHIPKKDAFIPGTVDLYAGLSELYRKRGDLETAQQLADTGLALNRQTIYSTSRDRLAMAMVHIQIGLGDFERGLTLLREVEQHSQQKSIFVRYPIPAMRAYIWLLQGKLDDALDWAKKTELSYDDELSFRYEFNYLTLVRVLIVLYQRRQIDRAIDEAQHLLTGLLNLARDEERTDSIIEILILQSIVYQVQGDNQTALDILGDVIKLAEPEGYTQVFVNEGDPMRQLLSMCLLQTDDSNYLTQLLQAFHQSDDETEPNQLLIEPLSDRELDVLRLIADGYTNQAIADELFIALSTVKKHVNNIYGKLNVANRTQAIKRAHELNIL